MVKIINDISNYHNTVGVFINNVTIDSNEFFSKCAAMQLYCIRLSTYTTVFVNNSKYKLLSLIN